jgi:hypothetical protein
MLLQFFSHSHKMLMSMLPEIAGGSRAFTGAEKTKLALGNSIVFGLGVWPFVSNMVDDIIAAVDPEMPPEKAQMIKTGMVDYLVSQALSVATGQDVDVRPQKSLAPMGNIEQTLTTFYDVVTMSPEYRPYISAPIATMGVVLDTMDIMTTAWKMDDEVFTNKDIYLRTLHTMAEIAPTISHITQATMAMKTGKLNSKFGNEVGEVNTVEALWKLTGFQTGVEVDYYSARDKFFELKSGSGGGKSYGKGREGEIRGEVNDLFTKYNRIMKTSPLTTHEKAAMFSRSLLLMYDKPSEIGIAMREINGLARKMRDRGEDNFWTDVIRYAYTSPESEELRKFTQYLNAPENLKYTLDAMEKVEKGGQ